MTNPYLNLDPVTLREKIRLEKDHNIKRQLEEALKIWNRVDKGPFMLEIERDRNMKARITKIASKISSNRTAALFTKSKDVKTSLIIYLKKYPTASPQDVFQWARRMFFNPDDVDRLLVEYAAKYADFLSSGRSTEKSVGEEEVDQTELRTGIQIETEHTTDLETAKKIALDHLAEHKDYYTALVAMEKALETKDSI